MTIEQILGAALMLLFLVDIFLTILYARAGTGLLAPYWNRAIWALLHGIAKLFGRRGGAILSLAGPLIVVSLIGFWALGLTVGAALVMRPELGTAIRPLSGETPTDFVTALLVAGNSLSIVGGGGYSPYTTGTRFLFLINSLIGASVLSLVLSYLVQVYSALRERNALALAIDLMTGRTGNAAEMLARLMPRGDSSNITSELSSLARSLAVTKEAHHFYPLLFYFRFREPLYSVSRFSFILLDLTTLIKTTLDHGKLAKLVDFGSVASLHHGALLLLETLDENFASNSSRAGDAVCTQRERQDYVAAMRTLASAGIALQPDSIEDYVTARRVWEPLARRVATTLGYTINDIDQGPQWTGRGYEASESS